MLDQELSDWHANIVTISFPKVLNHQSKYSNLVDFYRSKSLAHKFNFAGSIVVQMGVLKFFNPDDRIAQTQRLNPEAMLCSVQL